MLQSTRPYFSKKDLPNILKEVKEVISGGRLILGPYTKRFEQEFAKYTGVRYVIAVNSCTTALEISLKFFNVKGKEVILPTNTFVATAVAVLNAGGKPVFVDINEKTLLMDIEEAKEKVNKNTRGVIIVHIAGLIPPRIKELREFCNKRNLFLVEDAAHAHGAMFEGQKAGSFGDAGCFSFYPTKVMTTMTGGIITTNDRKLVNFARSLRHHGQGVTLEFIENLGNDWVMNEVEAILGFYQLRGLEENLRIRNNIAKIYTDFICKLKGATIFKVPPNTRHSYYKYSLLLDKPIRKKLAEFFKERDIEYGGSIYYPPVHLQPVFKRLFSYKEGMFPKSEDVLDRVFCLPLYPQMSKSDIKVVLSTLKEGLGRFML